MDLRGKKVTVVGLGKSGLSASNLLLEKGARLSITDCVNNQNIREKIDRLRHKQNIINIELGRHTENLINGQDLVIVSPGVPENSLPVLLAKKKGIPVIGEIELAFAFCPCPIIAITGTNGKTTVATLIGEIFKKAGRKGVVCGNIGVPFSSKVTHLNNEHIVILEISSFQLENIDKFRPKVAVVLNLSIDHLDRYAEFDEYAAAKSRIFSNQTEEDWAVINGENPHRFALAAKTRAKVLYFSKNNTSCNKFRYFNSNQLASLIIVSLFDIPEELAVNICKNFKGIEHRIEEVAQIRGVKFINDSKATNVNSTIWALDFIKKPVILIAGGKDKGSDFSVIRERIKGKVKALVLLGEAKGMIKEELADLVLTKEVETLSQAVREAFSLSRSGDCVLFSPMCASFDMFSDYAERGKVFKQAVHNLSNYKQIKSSKSQ